MTKKPKICTIVGPNASGKSDLAIRLAKALGGEIISADSRQVYKGMDLGSGKVSGHFASEEGFAVRVLERDFLLAPTISQEIRHWLIDIVEPQEPFTAAEFQQLSYYLIKAMAQRGKVPLLAGGTGLYIRSVLDGLSFPSVACNEELRKDLERRSTDELRKLLIEKDPEAAETVDINNPRRIIRAIEIIHGTGKSLKDVRTTAPVFFDTLTLGIAMTKEDINSRIRERLERRLKQGMIAEVESLLENGVSGERLISFGLEYRFIYLHLRGELTCEDMTEALYHAICRFAKRQYTWFRKYGNVHWLTSAEEAERLARDFLNRE